MAGIAQCGTAPCTYACRLLNKKKTDCLIMFDEGEQVTHVMQVRHAGHWDRATNGFHRQISTSTSLCPCDCFGPNNLEHLKNIHDSSRPHSTSHRCMLRRSVWLGVLVSGQHLRLQRCRLQLLDKRVEHDVSYKPSSVLLAKEL